MYPIVKEWKSDTKYKELQTVNLYLTVYYLSGSNGNYQDVTSFNDMPLKRVNIDNGFVERTDNGFMNKLLSEYDESVKEDTQGIWKRLK